MMQRRRRKPAGKGTVECLSDTRQRFGGIETLLGGKAEFVCIPAGILDFTVPKLMNGVTLDRALAAAKKDAQAVLQQYLGEQWKTRSKSLRRVRRQMYLATGQSGDSKIPQWLIELRETLSAAEVMQILHAQYVLNQVRIEAPQTSWHGIALGRAWQLMLDRQHEDNIDRGAKVRSGAEMGGRGRRKMTSERLAELKQHLQSGVEVTAVILRYAKEWGVSQKTLWRYKKEMGL